jgi:hypothetical protein
MTRKLIKILLALAIIIPVFYYGCDYLKFKMIGFPYAAGSYPYAQGYGFKCDYIVLKRKIDTLRRNENYRIPYDPEAKDYKDQYFEHILFYFKPDNIIYECLIDSACCNTCSIHLVAITYYDKDKHSGSGWRTVNNDKEVGWLENKRYLKKFRNTIFDKLNFGLPLFE